MKKYDYKKLQRGDANVVRALNHLKKKSISKEDKIRRLRAKDICVEALKTNS